MSQVDSPSVSVAQLPMVSHAEVALTTAPSRRPASISSRTSRSRHHQRGRSHHGGSSYTPQNEFPFFAQTGDVEVVIACDGQEKRYLLHRLILGQFSGFFDAGMSDEWARSLVPLPTGVPDALTVIGEEGSQPGQQPPPPVRPDQIRAPGRKRWRYELDWANLEEDEEPMLTQKPPSGGLFTASFYPSKLPPPRSQPNSSFFRSVANLTLGHPAPLTPTTEPSDPALSNSLIRDYDNLFRVFYNFTPHLNGTNIAAAYSECKALLTLADMYDALAVIGPRIDHHLLRFGSRLFKQIAKYPPSYLKLGYLSRTRIIFSEALTHVVGQWPAAFPYLKQNDDSSGYEVPQLVIDLIEDKVDELEELKQKIEAKLFRTTLTTSRGERVNPSNDYLGWLAMSLFRQWIAENTTPEVRGILKNNAPNSRPGSGHTNNGGIQQTRPMPPLSASRIYRLIASTNSQAYLAHDELKRFLKCQPAGERGSSLYSKDNLRRIERKMEEVKNIARDVVKPLTRNCLELDLRLLSDGGGGGLGYLTCVRCEEGDLPWD